MLPGWNAEGFFDPLVECQPSGVPNKFCPHEASMTEMVDVLGFNQPRLQLLSGLLSFREALGDAGLNQGFQWIDGSFVENTEDLRGRHPRDIDVVTFYMLPDGMNQGTLLSLLPNRKSIKADWHVDAYYLQLNGQCNESFIIQVCYWYALWSHNRERKWKGFIQVDLASDDKHAKDIIQQRMEGLSDVAR